MLLLIARGAQNLYRFFIRTTGVGSHAKKRGFKRGINPHESMKIFKDVVAISQL
jgi:hypothetical protein